MNVNAHSNFKKVAAKILLFFLIFIHAEKAIHYHETSRSISNETGFSISSKIVTCSICDYVFAKDAGMPEEQLVRIPLYDFPEWNSIVLPFFFDVEKISIIGRGPPAC